MMEDYVSPWVERFFPLDLVSAGFLVVIAFILGSLKTLDLTVSEVIASSLQISPDPTLSFIAIFLLIIPLSYTVGLLLFVAVDRVSKSAIDRKYLTPFNESLDREIAASLNDLLERTTLSDERSPIRIMRLYLIRSDPQTFRTIFQSYARIKRALMVFHGAFVFCNVELFSTLIINREAFRETTEGIILGAMAFTLFALAAFCVWGFGHYFNDEVSLIEQEYARDLLRINVLSEKPQTGEKADTQER